MQKQLSRVGRASSRSTKKGVQKKGASKKLAPNKRAARKRVHGSQRTKTSRSISPFLPRENRAYVLNAAGTAVSEASTTTAKTTKSLVPSNSLILREDRARALSMVDTAVIETSTTTTESTKSLVPSSLLVPQKCVAYVLSATGPLTPHASPTTTKRDSGYAWRTPLPLPPILTSLFGWRTYRLRMQQKRTALQMLVVNGSVRPGSVELRYSTDPDNVGTLCRSFAVSPLSDTDPPSPLQASCARLRARGIQFVQSLRLQDTYARLQSRSLQLLEWVRRELTARSYPSGI